MGTSIGLLVLRLGMGTYMLLGHGWGKSTRLLEGNFRFADPIGLGPEVSLVLTAGAEFVCAALVMAGLFTRWASIPLVIAMGVAAFAAHGDDPWFAQEASRAFRSGAAESWSSKEPALLFLFPFLALCFTGGGKYSLDHLIRTRRESKRS